MEQAMENINRFNNMANLQIFNLYLDTALKIILILFFFLATLYLLKRFFK